MPGGRKIKQSILLFDIDFELANSIKLYLEDTFNVEIINNIEPIKPTIKEFKYFLSSIAIHISFFIKIKKL